MPQQINLCTPILLARKRYFSAQAMLQALLLFVVAGAALCGYWVWSLNSASAGFRQTLNMHTREIGVLRQGLQDSKAAAAPIDASLNDELLARRLELQRREQLLVELQRGQYREGFGHSARLQLVAQSIPAQIWVTQVRADSAQLGLQGFTLEPAALNAWVERLGSSALLHGQKLVAIKVEQVAGESPAAGARAPAAREGVTPGRPLWSFELLSGATPAAARAASGVKR